MCLLFFYSVRLFDCLGIKMGNKMFFCMCIFRLFAFFLFKTVLRIRDVYPGSRMFNPGPGSEFFSIPDPRPTSKDISILTQKMVSKLSEI
jgi:hypothetical protein